jgi:hypothetical protein
MGLALSRFGLIYLSPYLPQPLRSAVIWMGIAATGAAFVCGKAILAD